jgi:Short-chain dehydrogenase involved in D-alanine esterification of lipoteichoic acid and wall teichoic acid (D-alanine transfer protein)
MKINNNTVLIIGGSGGIGLAMAERFLDNENEVIISSNSEEGLEAAKKKFPKLHTKNCDITDEIARERLYSEVVEEFPKLNVLFNCAGIQLRSNISTGQYSWDGMKKELATNLEAPMHLSLLFLSHLSNVENAVVINVSSDLAFRIPVFAPSYGAAKAGLHSFTYSFRVQTEPLGISVYEILPPAVNTDLGGRGLHTFGVDVDLFADEVFRGLIAGETEIGYGENLDMTLMPRREIEELALADWIRRQNK